MFVYFLFLLTDDTGDGAYSIVFLSSITCLIYCLTHFVLLLFLFLAALNKVFYFIALFTIYFLYRSNFDGSRTFFKLLEYGSPKILIYDIDKSTDVLQVLHQIFTI